MFNSLIIDKEFKIEKGGEKQNYVTAKFKGACKVRLNLFLVSDTRVDIFGILSSSRMVKLYDNVTLDGEYFDIENGGLYNSIEIKVNNGIVVGQLSGRS